MSDLRSPSQPASPVASDNLDQLVAAALCRHAALGHADVLGYARLAIHVVCQHVRDASLYTATPREIDPRVDAAIDEYLSGAPAVSPAAIDAERAAVDDLVKRIDAAVGTGWTNPNAEPTADDTITARVLPDGSHADIRHAGGR